MQYSGKSWNREPLLNKDPLFTIESIKLRHLPESSISLSCARGEVIGLCGGNGAGKTTLLRYIAGLDPDGNGKFRDTSHEKQIGLVFQHAKDNLIFSGLRKDVEFGLKNEHQSLSDEQFHNLLSFFELQEEETKCYRWMSAGVAERAALLSIWSQKPDLLLLDEAFSHQDPQTACAIFGRMIREVKSQNRSIIITTHEPEILAMTDIVYRLDQGRMTPAVPENIETGNERNPVEILLSDGSFTKQDAQSISGRNEIILAGFVPKGTGETNNQPETLRLENVSFSYPEKDIFFKQSCSIKRGTLYYMSGCSGSGKSTLMLLMAGLMRHEEGKIQIADTRIPSSGSKISGGTIKVIRKKIGFMGQHTERQLFCDTVWEDTAYAPSNLGINPSELDDCCEKALRVVGLQENLWRRSPFTLSTGEKRKAALAGIISSGPEILLLDDPYAEIDTEGIGFINQMIRNFITEGRTVVISGTGRLNV